MKRKIALIFFILVLCLGGYVFYKYSSDTPKPWMQKIKKTQTSQPEVIKSEIIKSSEESKADNYKITVEYPQFSGIKNSDAEKKINSGIKDYVANMVATDKKSAKENCNFSNLPGGAPDWQCEYNIAFNSFDTVAEKIISIKMEYYQFTGGAHGGTQFEFLNYNLDTGEKLDWKNVFKKDSNYLQIISDYSKAILEKELLSTADSMSGTSWISDGTKPTADNYNTNVGFYNESAKSPGLTIIFQQYQVAAYAQGPSEVVIPYANLKTIFDPSGPLGQFTK